MIEIKIDPKYTNDPILIEKKTKLEIAFKDWPCQQGRSGYIILSNDPESREFQDCRGLESLKEEFVNMMNNALYNH